LTVFFNFNFGSQWKPIWFTSWTNPNT